MLDWKLAIVLGSALLCSAIAYRAVDLPKPKNGMVILHWRVLIKGLAGSFVFIVAMLLGLAVVALLD